MIQNVLQMTVLHGEQAIKSDMKLIGRAAGNQKQEIFGGNDIANGRYENPIEYSSKHMKRRAHSSPNMGLVVFSPSFNLGWYRLPHHTSFSVILHSGYELFCSFAYLIYMLY